MKTRQFIGPFSIGQSLELDLSDVTYVQIGIEHPHSIPISEESPVTILSINNIDYSITEKDILEFENLNLSQLSIIIEEADNPYFIIDIAYK